MSFQNLGLIPELISAIETKGYKSATPIQAQSIPKILKGQDILAGSQTGTGKTAAFALPILQLLSNKNEKGKNPRALILTPTRELAAQILESIEEYGQKLSLRSIAIFGGVRINPQINKLKQGVDILVATPGRLLDHAGQKTLSLANIEILVLDEADRMLDMGFVNDIRKVVKLIPKERQTLLFSATYSEEIKNLSDRFLNNPQLIEVATQNITADNIAQVVHPVARRRKQEMLTQLINEGNWEQVLVFTRTKHGANRLAKHLILNNITASAIHSNKSQAARTHALADFKNGKVRVLVATDIAARGLDINLLPHVVNYELPDVSENYVHRIGRTGRAGANGIAVSLVCPEESEKLHSIQDLLNGKIPVELVQGFERIFAYEINTQKRKKTPGNSSKNKPQKDSKKNYGRKTDQSKPISSGEKNADRLGPKKSKSKRKFGNSNRSRRK